MRKLATITIYRVGSLGRRPAKAKLAAAVAEATRKDRVSRPTLVEWIATGGPWDLPEVPESAFRAYSDDWYERTAEDGFTVPEDSLGRSGEATRSNAESLRLWLKKFDAVIPAGTLRVVRED